MYLNITDGSLQWGDALCQECQEELWSSFRNHPDIQYVAEEKKRSWHADVLQCCLFGCIESDLIKLCAACSGSGTQGLLLVHLLQTVLAASYSCVSFHLKAQVECVRRAHRVVHPSKNMALELNSTGCHADGGGHMLYTADSALSTSFSHCLQVASIPYFASEWAAMFFPSCDPG